jgi:hypothetical protein
MKTSIKLALVTLAFAGAPLMSSHPASAQVAVVVPGGNIAFGYNDGYWDRSHSWHTWNTPAEATQYRTENQSHYYDYKHDRDGDGWREKDTWWDHH